MDAQDILQSLSNLEQSLKNIDSARQQVINTVNAYENARTQLNLLTTEFTSISSNLKGIVKTINENQDTLSTTLSQKVEDVFSSFNSKVKDLEESTNKIHSSFESSCQLSSKTFNDSVSGSITKIEDQVNSAISNFNQKATIEIEGIATALNNFKEAANEMQTQFQSAISTATCNQKTNNETIASDFLKSVGEHLSSFDELSKKLNDIFNDYSKLITTISTTVENEVSKLNTTFSDGLSSLRSENKNQYDDVVNKLKSLREGNIKAADNLSARFTSVDTEISAIKSAVVSIIPRIDSATTFVLKENKGNIENAEKNISNLIDELKQQNSNIKQLVLFCLIAAAISIILNIVILTH